MKSQGYGNVTQFETRIEEIDQKLAEFNDVIPNIKDSPGLLVDFYNSARSNNVEAKSISFGKTEAKDNYSSFLVSLDVSGTKRSVYNFIKEIENYPRLSRISKVEFEPKEGDAILAKITDEFFILNDIKADPQEYPFVNEKGGFNFLFDIFGLYKAPGESEGQPGQVSVKNQANTNIVNPYDKTNTGNNTGLSGGNEDLGLLIKNSLPNLNASMVIKNNRAFIPLSALQEIIGVKVEYDSTKKNITINKNDKFINFTINKRIAMVGEKQKLMYEAAADTDNGDVMVPLRFILESFGVRVDWNNQTKTVIIE